MDKHKLLSQIVKLQTEITSAVIKGYQCNDDDIFKEQRKKLMKLRCELFGNESKLCLYEMRNCRKC